MLKTQATLGIAALGAVLLVGCAAPDGKYPSLAIRDAERTTGQFAPTAPADTVPTYTTDRGLIGDALERARASHQTFLARQPEVGNLARSAAGRGPESDRRSQALVALADLTILRSKTAIALADLDRLEVEAATLFAPTDEINTAQDYVARLVGEQDAALDSLERVMGL